jgi:hypothetical protein
MRFSEQMGLDMSHDSDMTVPGQAIRHAKPCGLQRVLAGAMCCAHVTFLSVTTRGDRLATPIAMPAP